MRENIKDNETCLIYIIFSNEYWTPYHVLKTKTFMNEKIIVG